MKYIYHFRFLFVVLSCQAVLAQKQHIKLCVVEENLQECHRMTQDVSRRLSQTIECITGRDRLECMRKVSKGEADTVNVSPEDAYVGSKHLKLVPLLFEEYKNSLYTYRTAAVVNSDLKISNLTELKGKRSCHGGYRDAASWTWPMSMMMSSNVISSNCSSDLANAANFFSASCIPGRWSSLHEFDKRLKGELPQLCSLCESKCSLKAEDTFSGLEGPLRCLHNGSGDVAFTTVEAASNFFKNLHPTKQANFRYLCLDGTTVPLSEPCYWASRPANLFVTSSEKEQGSADKLRTSLRSIFSRVLTQNQSWLSKAFVSSDKVTRLDLPTSDLNSIEQYLGNGFISSVEKKTDKCSEKMVKFCVSSGMEEKKCQDLSRIALANELKPAISCYYANSHASCLAAIENGQADLITLDPGDVYLASKYHNMVPIMAEQYGDLNMSYLAVAVVRRDSGIASLEDLKDKRSCHTGIGRSAGWDVPVGLMIQQQLIKPKDCRFATSVAEFFSGGSCAPGAKSVKYDPYEDNPESLCSLCVGDENSENKCSRSSSERLGGYAGAFRCLAADIGDVAFVKHTTVTSYTDRNSDVEWTRGLRSTNYVILCRDGGTRNVDEYENCYLEMVPSHAVMTSQSKTSAEIADMITLLSAISDKFGPKSMSFKVFGTYDGVSDLMFKDSTTALINIYNEGADPISFLGEYGQLAANLDPRKCQEKSPAPCMSLSHTLLVSSIFIGLKIFCYS